VRTLLWANSLVTAKNTGNSAKFVGSLSLRLGCEGVICEGLQAESQRRAKKLAGNFTRPIRERNSYIKELYSRIRESIKAPLKSPLVGPDAFRYFVKSEIPQWRLGA